MSETVLRTEKFELEVAWGHSLYLAELGEDGMPVEDLHLDWKDLKDLMAKPQ